MGLVSVNDKPRSCHRERKRSVSDMPSNYLLYLGGRPANFVRREDVLPNESLRPLSIHWQSEIEQGRWNPLTNESRLNICTDLGSNEDHAMVGIRQGHRSGHRPGTGREGIAKTIMQAFYRRE